MELNCLKNEEIKELECLGLNKYNCLWFFFFFFFPFKTWKKMALMLRAASKTQRECVGHGQKIWRDLYVNLSHKKLERYNWQQYQK